MEKKVLLKSRFEGWRLHSLYTELISNPPSGFSIKFNENTTSTQSVYKLDNKSMNPILKEIIYQVKSIPYIIIQQRQKQNFNEYDLVYASQHVLFNSESKWISDLEFANALSAYGNIKRVKQKIKKQLESKNCKAIIPWSEWSKRTLLKSLDCKKFEEKIHVIPYTTIPKKMLKENHEGINFLFVGSENLLNNKNIQFKNLKEVIIAFNEISKKYDKINLIIRSSLTPELKNIISNNSKIQLIESYLSKQDLEKIYLSSDIFVLPSYETNGIALMEAMSYGLAVISMKIFDIPELILDEKNGILIEPPLDMKIYSDTESPNDYSWEFFKQMKKNSPYIIEQLKKSFEFLIGNKSLRRKISEQAKLTIENGQFSIKNRNDKLKQVFESALK